MLARLWQKISTNNTHQAKSIFSDVETAQKYKYRTHGAGRTAQWVKVLTAKPGHLSSFLGPHVGRGLVTPARYLLNSTCMAPSIHSSIRQQM